MEFQKRIKELETEIEMLKYKIRKLEKENRELKKKQHNDRGAGRKPKFTDSEISIIKMYRLQGKSLKEIANTFECSISLIHNILKEGESDKNE